MARARVARGQRHVVAGVLDRDPPAQKVLHPADARGHVRDRLVGERQRQQVVEMAVVAAPAQVLAVERHAM
jgi:hypothetical protein